MSKVKKAPVRPEVASLLSLIHAFLQVRGEWCVGRVCDHEEEHAYPQTDRVNISLHKSSLTPHNLHALLPSIPIATDQLLH